MHVLKLNHGVHLASLANCTAGEERNATKEQCMPCQKGWYQEQKWQDRCVPCGTDKTTPDQGSRNKSDCVRKYDTVILKLVSLP